MRWRRVRRSAGQHRRRSQAVLILVVGAMLTLVVLADQMGWRNHG